MILLDTCAIIWTALQPSKLTPKAQQAIQNNENELMICDISIWEIAMLISKKRLTVDSTAAEFIDLIIQSQNYQVQPITAKIAELSVSLGSEINADPADRLISATSILNNMSLVTADQNLRGTTMVKTIW